MADSQFPNGSKPQNPTAQRLGEVISAWLPSTPTGLYDQYLQTLSPAYDHLLTYSRYDRIWRFSEHTPHSLSYHSEISLMSSPVIVMDIGENDRVTDHSHYDGTDPESMRELESHLSNADTDSEDRQRFRIICAQHITCLSMEALGTGLSLDPNVFSHHIGTSFKDIEKSTGIYKLCNTKIEQIPSSVGTFEYEKNLQILKGHLGRLSIANVEHAKDLTTRDSIVKSIYHLQGQPITFSVDVPRTIYVQGYQSEDDRTQTTGRSLRARVLALQDRVLNRRIARERFVDDSMFCDQGERYSQNGLDILQNITIHVINDSLNPELQQVLVLFPPCPNLDGDNTDNDPHVFLDPLTKQEITKSFKDFCRNREKKDHAPAEGSTASRRATSQDVEIFAKDIVIGNQPGTPRNPAETIHLIRSYALNAWFDRLQTLKDQLEDLSLQSLFHRGTTHNEDPQDSDEENHTVDGLIDEEGIKSAILRYISSLDGECQRLKLDLRAAKIGSSTKGLDSVRTLDETMEKYIYIRSQMGNLLSETQHLLDMKNSKKQEALATRQTKESREFIEQATTVKRYDIRLS
ncbi:hypothetical protein N7471_001293 [Penicillium samsonianum]|uniref:uncharacterized protein n=1 Tax=Penicillium samsonianum TaxID=1882272 RepID=UPI00254936DF|nr:uncharacterized protein N7471_001293 [Penicillium samsonianum]KAJ6150094.1 hypothetical protein N7471_001293 [Penicillium samsonianum]